jgi:hypothetical protein
VKKSEFILFVSLGRKLTYIEDIVTEAESKNFVFAS